MASSPHLSENLYESAKKELISEVPAAPALPAPELDPVEYDSQDEDDLATSTGRNSLIQTPLPSGSDMKRPISALGDGQSVAPVKRTKLMKPMELEGEVCQSFISSLLQNLLENCQDAMTRIYQNVAFANIQVADKETTDIKDNISDASSEMDVVPEALQWEIYQKFDTGGTVFWGRHLARLYRVLLRVNGSSGTESPSISPTEEIQVQPQDSHVKDALLKVNNFAHAARGVNVSWLYDVWIEVKASCFNAICCVESTLIFGRLH